jgi:Zn-dependent protease
MNSIAASLNSGFLTTDRIIEFGINLMIIFLIVPIHEYAHAWAATKLGDDTPRLQGRLTLNPLAHVDPIGAICMFLCGFGWGRPVQINPLRFRQYRKGMALCAAAGPISNLIVALLGMIVYKFVDYGYIASLYQNIALGWLSLIFQYFTLVNLGLAVFNLIPIPPLDGSKILSYFVSRKWDEFVYRNQMVLQIVLFALILSPVLSTPLTIVRNLLFNAMDKITFFVDIIAKAVFGLS